MASLLTNQWKPTDTSWIQELLGTAARINEQRHSQEQARNQSVALALANQLQQQRQFETKLLFDKEQEARVNRQFAAKHALEVREKNESDSRYWNEETPYIPPTPTDSMPKPSMPTASAGRFTGPVVDAPLGEPPAFMASGTPAASPGTALATTSSDFTTGFGETLPPMLPEDTVSTPVSSPAPGGVFGSPAPGFSFGATTGAPAPVEQVSPAPVAPVNDNPLGLPPRDFVPAQKNETRSMAAELADIDAGLTGLPKRVAEKAKAEAVVRIAANRSAREAATTTKPVVRSMGNSLVQLNPATGQWEVVAERPERPITRLVDGALQQFDRETGTWEKVVEGPGRPITRLVDGALQQFDKETGLWEKVVDGPERKKKVKNTFQDEAGKLYTQFDDGSWDSEPGEGVKVSRVGSPQRPEDPQKQLDALLREQRQWQTEAASLDRIMSKLDRPKRPISSGGKFFKDVAGEREEITATEFQRLKARADEAEAEITEKKKQRDGFLARSQTAQQQIDTIRSSSQPGVKGDAPAPATPAAPAAASPTATPGAKSITNEVVSEVNAALKRGVTKEQIVERLKERGYDTRALNFQ